MNKSTATRLGQILLEKGLITAEQLDIAIKEQQKRRQLLDPFDSNLGVNSSLGEILIELGFIDRLQLKRGLNWQLMLRKMAIVMSFCAPLMTASVGAAAGTTFRPSFTAEASSSSAAAKVTPGFTVKSSSASSAPVNVDGADFESSSSINANESKSQPLPVLSSAASSSSRSSLKSSSSSSSKASAVVSSLSKSSSSSSKTSSLDVASPKMPDKITVAAAFSDQVQLEWLSATDNVEVVSYKIYRDQVQIDTVDGSQNSYFDFNVAAGKTYLYGVSAGDAAGNWSVIKSVFVQTASVPLESGSQVSSAPSSVTSSSVAAVSSSGAKSSVASSASSASSKSSAPVTSSSKSSVSSISTSSVSSKASSSSSSVSGLGVKSVTVEGPVNFNWVAPNLRENGNNLDITEVGGYELRYRKLTDVAYTYVTINDAWKNYYNFSWLAGTYVFQVAAFDKNGLYSNFVDIAPQ
ncbi:hypothetical protein GCM10011613_32250 [Cellvibrio zantedeschiae]|uniref:Fibronectin type-III domain-containing protein n=1 Tax=Cellvibrio zantedeschiae TaxID=1237077 RepID=A0ABQ3BD63_9GAMM|nr:fibronectin type III domain-containing protein [Cellvibrio zantedeschiae]GGY84768.1 hypothetical protein GCM10011613_32250 [Cellvibrio zantedeschiae]